MSGSAPRRTPLRRRLATWLEHHRDALASALGRFRGEPGTSLMTTGAIAIALCLPGLFLVLLDNLQSVTGRWQGTPEASVFLQVDTSAERRDQLAGTLRARPEVSGVRVIPADEALAEFRTHSDLDGALEMLEENPLPAVLIVEPAASAPAEALSRLVAEVEAMAPVDRVRLDSEWVRRLEALMRLAERSVWVVTALLGITVVLVVGNTIRLDIENRREVITIAKLIGATDAFVRRPFLYGGLCHGILGGVLACLLVELGRALLAEPVNRLAALYESGFRLGGVGLSGAATVIACGAVLGLLGAWAAVARHLDSIEPR